MDIREISIDEYDYQLQDERIAKFPLQNREESKLLLYRDGEVSESVFKNLPDYLPEGSLVVFNNTRVIRARLLFAKDTGAKIEIFCLEPEEPRDYAMNFQADGQCRWTCLVGNSKRWKEGVLKRALVVGDTEITLSAERLQSHGETHSILFKWAAQATDNSPAPSFADVLDAAGVLPIPPYLHRDTEESDLQSYQTVYSKIKGSVAAPTAGLHFTTDVLDELEKKGFGRTEVTLHVGAGTFKPVQSETIGEHEMHTELISVTRASIAALIESLGRITAVGTTSVRTLESLYFIGATLAATPSPESLDVKQWTPYERTLPNISTKESLTNIVAYLDRLGLERLIASTQIIIAPGYEFRVVDNMITNFHQPKSTLLLLVSAFVKGEWRAIYDQALTRNFRFLSYGDSSLLFRR